MQPPTDRALPRQLLMAVRLMYAGAGLSAVGLVLASPSHAARVIPIGNPHSLAYQDGTVLGRFLFAAAAAGLWLWMSWAVKRGKGWARAVSTVFFLLGAEPTIASLLAQRWVSAAFLTLATLVGMATIILLNQPNSSTFFAYGWASADYAPPPGQAPETVPLDGQPAHPAASPWRKILTIVAVGVVAVAIIAAVIADVVVGTPTAARTRIAASTASVRVIVPAPTEAGGLRQDYADENTPKFRAALATVRKHYQQIMSATKTNIAIAIYTDALPGALAGSASVTLVYVGANSPRDLANKGTAVDLVGGAVAHMTNVSATALRGGPGDTTYECATGLDHGQTAVVCGWSTDRSFGLLFQTSPGGTVSELAALMRKMRPDLVDQG